MKILRKTRKAYLPATLLAAGFLFMISGSVYAQISADISQGGAIRIGDSNITCNSSAEGALRYNSVSKSMQFCDGTAWTQTAQVQGTTPPTVPTDAGYFVLTETRWNGNLGGISGADAKCLTELTTNTDWMGYADANSRGILTPHKVRAFLLWSSPLPLTTYNFATVGNAGYGGSSFTADSDTNVDMGNASAWSSSDKFGVSALYWGHRRGNTGCDFNGVTGWRNESSLYCSSTPSASCTSWTSNANGDTGRTGDTGGVGNYRWSGGSSTCDIPRRLVCLVNP